MGRMPYLAMRAASWSSSICSEGGLGGGTTCVSAIFDYLTLSQMIL